MDAPEPRFLGEPLGRRSILLIGDSLTEGYFHYGCDFHPYALSLVDRLRAHDSMHDCIIAEAGLSGEGTDTMVARLDKLLAERWYSLVVILGGTNDLARRRPVADISRELAAMHEAVVRSGARTVALTVPERSGERDSAEYLASKQALNTFIQEGLPGSVEVIDLCAALPYYALDAAERERLWDDGLHFTAAGYDRVGEIVFDGIVDLLPELRHAPLMGDRVAAACAV
eukprot:c21295_g1_i1.p1 GENE.c21295_g1_i1~~c21295_g1_i1.p1  ORF type:complete len:228 (-),score=39.90 c21295_g1_i1:34-717(-)